jgi:hypothetical protein
VTLALGGLFNRRFAEECAKLVPADLLALESVPAAAVHVAIGADAVVAVQPARELEPDLEPEPEPEPEPETEPELETTAQESQTAPAPAADQLPRSRGKPRPSAKRIVKDPD